MACRAPPCPTPTHPGGGHELTIEVWRSYGEGVSAEELCGILRSLGGWEPPPL